MNGSKPKWYQMPHWRRTGPGGYYGGLFAGIGLGLMLPAVAAIAGYIQPSVDALFIAGVSISVITSVACAFIEGIHNKNNRRQND
jgi:Na+/H+-dicarboxylate symporter